MNFCRFSLRTAVDQIEFMADLLDTPKLAWMRALYVLILTVSFVAVQISSYFPLYVLLILIVGMLAFNYYFVKTMSIYGVAFSFLLFQLATISRLESNFFTYGILIAMSYCAYKAVVVTPNRR
ncbi:MAG TPA: hypothetical protein VNR18_14685 [Hyphomicrobiales bacterium]|nr:hypothetical protein [Hyphomicrobiales bacterium]